MPQSHTAANPWHSTLTVTWHQEDKRKQLLSCQPRVTVTSCFVCKVIRDLESIDPLCINPIRRIGLIHKWSINSRLLKWGVHVSVLFSNGKQSIASLSFLVGTIVTLSSLARWLQIKKGGKDQESIQSSTMHTWPRIPHGKVTKTQTRVKRSADHNAAMKMLQHVSFAFVWVLFSRESSPLFQEFCMKLSKWGD